MNTGLKKDKLIIWDFDGVIADTEHVWLSIWNDIVNKHFRLGWDFEETMKWFCGLSDKGKIEQLGKHFAVEWTDSAQADLSGRYEKVLEQGFKLVEGMKDVIALDRFARCMATNGHGQIAIDKIKSAKIEEFFPPEYVFPADLVSHGKPAPDLFLYAAEKMGYSPQEVIVVEDSLSGLRAGLSAGMKTLAFVGCSIHYFPNYIEEVKALGITEIFYDMPTLRDYLRSLY